MNRNVPQTTGVRPSRVRPWLHWLMSGERGELLPLQTGDNLHIGWKLHNYNYLAQAIGSGTSKWRNNYTAWGIWTAWRSMRNLNSMEEKPQQKSAEEKFYPDWETWAWPEVLWLLSFRRLQVLSQGTVEPCGDGGGGGHLLQRADIVDKIPHIVSTGHLCHHQMVLDPAELPQSWQDHLLSWPQGLDVAAPPVTMTTKTILCISQQPLGVPRPINDCSRGQEKRVMLKSEATASSTLMWKGVTKVLGDTVNILNPPNWTL